MTEKPLPKPLTDDEIAALRQLVEDYERSSVLGRAVWKATLVTGGFLVGLATFLAATTSFLHSIGAPK